jgi:hypothetical protein
MNYEEGDEYMSRIIINNHRYNVDMNTVKLGYYIPKQDKNYKAKKQKHMRFLLDSK